MTTRKHIAAVALLAVLTVPALAGCDGGSSQPANATAVSDPSLARAAAVRQQAAAAEEACVARGTNRATCTAYGSDIAVTYPGACHLELDKPLDKWRVESCADDLREAEAQGKPIPTTATPTATAAPAQQASSSERGIGSAISGLLSTLLSLAMGFVCIFGIPGVIGYVIYRRVRADRRERAHARDVHREEGSWQEGGDTYSPYAEPHQYAPTEPDHNPWA
ncbi:hypothetical protein [Tsukamurella pseudospumae]|uniref:Uncharacterized protein n=1 Tax=Tsukamurella pseudospumae TaxID=239498 RepID=A0A138ATZ3_9ACTN|nr:hypothetical protein [Tsukamurella pseudospumae]KXP13921.1 hypothetical protein AXK60_22725 [Tsukamurella pseudospumae]